MIPAVHVPNSGGFAIGPDLFASNHQGRSETFKDDQDAMVDMVNSSFGHQDPYIYASVCAIGRMGSTLSGDIAKKLASIAAIELLGKGNTAHFLISSGLGLVEIPFEAQQDKHK